ncbi:SigB/SigF/SigG family RNA polymerase sigma factor [Streptomyces sp. L2]|uniref:SigB/SigF/SigG family RNA polymerase sigma factor n=1 Tax=Streptomyces sp. L2 TaxID=2162665 RepID=UPI001012243F|nr:SigB/SigF/SigG family RNA polymerase sigma factor [Streptomyces sp. L2]
MTPLSTISEPGRRRTSGAPARADAPLSSENIDDLVRGVALQPPGPARAAARDRVIRRLLPLARRIAAKYRGVAGEEQDDLVQVACLGLVKAVDGYDPGRGHAFLSYALPTVTGELKRHLRDRTGPLRLPRPVQEARQRVRRAQEELEQRSRGRPPTPAEIGRVCGLTEEAVTDALRSEAACHPRSLDANGDGADALRPALADTLGGCDAALDLVADRVSLAHALGALPERERHILYLRFFHDQTQAQIAEAVGLSQMHVSRLLKRCLARLRDELLPPEPETEPDPRAAGARPGTPPAEPPRRETPADASGPGTPAEPRDHARDEARAEARDHEVRAEAPGRPGGLPRTGRRETRSPRPGLHRRRGSRRTRTARRAPTAATLAGGRPAARPARATCPVPAHLPNLPRAWQKGHFPFIRTTRGSPTGHD